MHSNFISPPEILKEDQRKNHSVLLIDPDKKTVLDVAMFCKSVGTDFDVYLYAEVFDDLVWLETAFNVVDVVLINTEPTKLSPIKDKLLFHQKSYHYGPKNFVRNNKKLQSVIEYFLFYIQSQQNLDLTD